MPIMQRIYFSCICIVVYSCINVVVHTDMMCGATKVGCAGSTATLHFILHRCTLRSGRGSRKEIFVRHVSLGSRPYRETCFK